MISERFRPDNGWDDPTPHCIRDAAITQAKGFAHRNGVTEADGGAFTSGTRHGQNTFAPGTEGTGRIRTEETGIAAH
jgi:hypothetical protein